jgi:hypothetical protein
MRSEFQDQGVSLHQPQLVALELESGFREPYNNKAVKAPQCAYGEIRTGEVQKFVRWNLKQLSLAYFDNVIVCKHLSGIHAP